MSEVDEHVARWRGWVEGPIRNDIIGMNHKRQIWRELAEMLTANPAVADTPSAFWDWLRETYVTTQAIGVRRQADRDTRTCSLARLIEEMRDDAPRLTRAYFLSLWDDQHDAWEMRLANEAFDRLAGEGREHLDPAVPAADLARLRSDAAKMARYVNEHLAHDMAEPTMTELPTFADLNAAIDALGALFRKYANVLTAGTYLTLEPVIQHDWTAVFRQAWLRD